MRALIVSIVVAGLATTTADATLLALWDAAFPGASPLRGQVPEPGTQAPPAIRVVLMI